jgi:23S rRNA (pseudouridine1915-N3)-methyltransferase
MVIGKTTFDWVDHGCEEYIKRLRKYFSFEKMELPNVKSRGKMSAEMLKLAEGEIVLKNLKPNDTLILLDENGLEMKSEKFARLLQTTLANKKGHLVFLIGGMFGAGEKIKDRADFTMSLSQMTFSHQQIRILFLEQLYRACTILNGEPYHNE